MRDGAVTDAGPVIHLYEAAAVEAFEVFASVTAPARVRADVLRHRGWDALSHMQSSRLRVTAVDAAALAASRPAYGSAAFSDADISVAALAAAAPSSVVLTDDLALRSALEARGCAVVGSVGILVRAYKTQRVARLRFEEAIDRLLDDSTLYLSRAFRGVVRRMVADLHVR